MIVSHTPLRISFAGGGTDLPDFYRKHGGAVLSIAMDKGITVAIDSQSNDLISINSAASNQTVKNIGDVDNEFIREALRKTGVECGVKITITSDITSEGSGLGSSSCLMVGLLNALYRHRGVEAGAERLAEEACEVEIDVLGKPIGKQDQYIAAYGGVHHFEFRQNGSVAVTPLSLRDEHLKHLQSSIMLLSTGITRKSAMVLKEQKKNIGDRVEVLKALRDLSFELRAEWEQGNIDHLGEVLDRGWKLKKQLASKIANPEIDAMYESAKKAGAVGGKIAGAGGGGYMTLFVPPTRRDAVSRALEEYEELAIAPSAYGSRILRHD